VAIVGRPSHGIYGGGDGADFCGGEKGSYKFSGIRERDEDTVFWLAIGVTEGLRYAIHFGFEGLVGYRAFWFENGDFAGLIAGGTGYEFVGDIGEPGGWIGHGGILL
jgi:hypothetical protein